MEEVMSNKGNRIHQDQQLISGIQKHFGKSGVLVGNGEKHTASEMIGMLERRIEAAEPVAQAKAAWQNAVRAEQALLAESDPVVRDVRKYITLLHGSSLEVLADFGIFPKSRRALTAEEMATRVAKSEATRRARHTMGKRQKAKVHPTTVNGPTSGS
jgi:hypothetical protein